MYKKYHIAFFGHKISFDYHRIGGLESFYRRIAHSLSHLGQRVSFVLYGADEDYSEKISEGIILKNFVRFNDSIKYLSETDVVFDNYIDYSKRIPYILFRINKKNFLKFGHIFSGIPNSALRKTLISILSAMFPYNGPLISLPLINLKSQKNLYQLFPPVPESFYLSPEKKSIAHQRNLRLSFIGRVDGNKGIHEAIQIMNHFSKDNAIKCSIYGYLGHSSHSNKNVHNILKKQNKIFYECQQWEKWKHGLDDYIQTICHNTDILILPYRNLVGTMDPPLLLLEGMASSCAILTTDLPNIRSIYGKSPFIVSHDNFVDKSLKIVKASIECSDTLYKEQQRVYERIQALDCESSNVANKFLSYILR